MGWQPHLEPYPIVESITPYPLQNHVGVPPSPSSVQAEKPKVSWTVQASICQSQTMCNTSTDRNAVDDTHLNLYQTKLTSVLSETPCFRSEHLFRRTIHVLTAMMPFLALPPEWMLVSPSSGEHRGQQSTGRWQDLPLFAEVSCAFGRCSSHQFDVGSFQIEKLPKDRVQHLI